MKGINCKAADQIIVDSQDYTGFTKYKPSVIAAAAVIAVCELLLGDGNVKMSARERCWLSLLKTGHVNAEQVKKCNELMMMMCWNKKICVDGLKEEVFKNGSLIMTMVSGEAPSSATSSSHRHGKQPVIPGEASSSSATTSSRRA